MLLLLFSHSIVSNSLRPHGLQHTRLPCPSPSSRTCSNSCPLSRWCHPSISSSVIPSSSCLQSFPATGSFQMSPFFPSGGQSIGVSALASVLPMNIQDWSPLGWTGLLSLQSKGLSRDFSSTTVQKHQFFHSAFFIVQLSHPYMTTGKTIALTEWRPEVGGSKASGGSKLRVAEVCPFSVEDTWFPLNLPFLRLWANPCAFLMEMFFLNYVKETMYLLWILPFFKLVSLKTKFFLFSNLGLIMAQETSIHVHCLMARDDTSCAILSQKCILWERGLVKLPQPWGVSFIWLAAGYQT